MNAAKHTPNRLLTLTLTLVLFSACMLQVAPPITNSGPDLIGKQSVVAMDLGWDAFLDDWEAKKNRGLYLVDVEPYSKRGKLLFAGLYHNQNPKTEFYQSDLGSGNDWTRFQERWSSQRQRGFRLIDVDIYNEGSRHYVLSIWQPGNYETAIRVNVTPGNNFDSIRDEMRRANRALVDFEPYEYSGRVFYVLIFREGSGDEYFKTSTSSNFTSKWNDLQRTRELIDFEIFADNGPQYAGIWRSGGVTGQLVIEADSAAFVQRFFDYDLQGMYLNDIEIESRDGRQYSGVWSMQNIGR